VVDVRGLPPSAAALLVGCRDNFERFSLEGLGIALHPKQVEAGLNIFKRLYQYILLTWANRAGKTTLLCVIHLYAITYKIGMDPPSGDTEEEEERDYRERWLPAGYRTLHCAPLNALSLKAYKELQEILKGTSVAQRDPATGKRREAPFLALYTALKERNEAGIDHIILRCASGGATDFLSTEGGAARLEGEPWRLITWDEWPATEGDLENARFVLDVRLTNRAADFAAPIVLTGTLTVDTEPLGKEWIAKCEDPAEPDWWGNYAERIENPSANRLSIERAKRNLTQEDYDRTVRGRPGGMKGRLYPDWLLTNAFRKDLPEKTPPVPGDGCAWDPTTTRRVNANGSPYTYILLCDLAIADADNVFTMFRFPKDYRFTVASAPSPGGQSTGGPIIGVRQVVVPGSRTLTDDDILATIEETFLPYGGLIVLDTTDAHGKNVHRLLRQHGFPVREFDFHDRNSRGLTFKEAGEEALRALLAEQTGDSHLTGNHDEYGVPEIDRTQPFGVIRMPDAWKKHRDQLSVLKPPPGDSKQKKDAAMTVVMMAELAQRLRPGPPAAPAKMSVFTRGHHGNRLGQGTRQDRGRPR
jgi:hypothetical protein